MSDNQDFDLSEFDVDPFDDGGGYDDDDDLIDSYEEDDDEQEEKEELSPEEFNRRVEAFQKEAKKKQHIALKAKKFTKAQRVEAVRWLGESGELTAIPTLDKIYRKDKTPGMKEEAAYALGQFKSLKLDLDDGEMADTAMERLEGIILHDQFGKRANSLPLIIGEVVLVALAIVLFAFGVILLSQNAAEQQEFTQQTQTAAPTFTPDTEDAVRADLTNYYTGLANDSNFYREQLAAASRGAGIVCAEGVLSANPPYTLSEQWAGNTGYSDAAATLNTTRDTLQPVAQRYAGACAQGVAMPREEALNLGSTIIDVQRSLADVRDTLAAAGINIEAQTPASATQAPPPTVDPANPPPTQDLSIYDDDIVRMEFIINDMTDQLGAASQNVFNWQQVVDTNTVYRSGCNQPRPIIPDDFALSASLAGTNTILDSAVTNLNTGLQSTRLSVEAFYASCDANEVPQDAAGRAAQAQLGLAAFEAAQFDIDALQSQ